MSKGSNRRQDPTGSAQHNYESGWDRVFGKKQQLDKCRHCGHEDDFVVKNDTAYCWQCGVQQ